MSTIIVCNFCNKPNTSVELMIHNAGPSINEDVAICSDCVAICVLEIDMRRKRKDIRNSNSKCETCNGTGKVDEAITGFPLDPDELTECPDCNGTTEPI